MKKKEVRIEIGESRCILIDRAIYGFAGNFNILYKINLETGAVEIIGSLPDEEFDNCCLVIDMFRNHNDLLCIPYTAKKIHSYNLETGLWDSISVHEKKQWGPYYNICLWQEAYYVFPFVEADMLRIGRKDKKIISRIDIREQYKKITGSDYKYFSHSGCHLFQDKVYMMMRDVPMMAEYDMALDQLFLYQLEGDSQVYVCLAGHEEKIYVLGSDGKVYLWDALNHETEKTIPLELSEKENERYKLQAKQGKYIYLFKYIFSDEFIRIDTEEKQADVLSLKTLFSVEKELVFLAADKEKFYFCSPDHILYGIDFESKEVHILPLVPDQEKLQEHIAIHLKELDERIENPKAEGCCVWTLENFIKRYLNVHSSVQNMQQENIGEKIMQIMQG